MRNLEFPNCCGARTISELGYSAIDASDAPSLPKALLAKGLINSLNEHSSGKAFSIIVATEQQMWHIGDVLENAGFKVVSQGINDNHHTHLFLLVKNNPVPDYVDPVQYGKDGYDRYYEKRVR